MNEIFLGFENVFARQLHFFCGKTLDVSDHQSILKRAKDRYLYCLSRKKMKHVPSHILSHADEYTSFLFILSSEAWKDSNVEVAELAYLLNRRLNNFDCFYTREMPDVFHLEHPIGSVIGQAVFGEYLVVYQGVAVGADMKLRYPKIDQGVALFAKSSVIGPAIIGSNCAIGAGTQVYGGYVSSDTAVSLRDGLGVVCSPLTWSVEDRFFK